VLVDIYSKFGDRIDPAALDQVLDLKGVLAMRTAGLFLVFQTFCDAIFTKEFRAVWTYMRIFGLI
jgi:hypothetical protein